jgi:hypothetical protein
MSKHPMPFGDSKPASRSDALRVAVDFSPRLGIRPQAWFIPARGNAPGRRVIKNPVQANGLPHMNRAFSAPKWFGGGFPGALPRAGMNDAVGVGNPGLRALKVSKPLAITIRFLLLTAALSSLAPASAWACAACYGQSDSPMAQGMNWGILSLLGCIGLVLAGVGGFFIYLARRGTATRVEPSRAPTAQPSAASWTPATSKV